MKRPSFQESELDVIGTYPGLKSVDLMGVMTGFGQPVVLPKRNRPISGKENWRLLLTGQKPYWIPLYGLIVGDRDVIGFRPRENSDNIANHQVWDGGPYYDYTGLGNIIYSSWFGLLWEFVPSIGGATVRPGNPKISDMNRWREVIEFPDLDAIDWEACGRRNREYLDTDKMVTLGIQCGIWERLMSLMDCEQAAIAMIDDEQTDAVKDFFYELTSFYIDYISRLKAVCPGIDNVLIHEDWCHQNGPFFSPETAEEMLVPSMRRLADFCHANGMTFEHHCCGRVEKMIEVMMTTGADFWCGQLFPLNDTLAMAKMYKDRPFAFGVPAPNVPEDASPQQIQEIADRFVDEYGDCRIIIANREPIPGPVHDALYRAYRKKF